MITWPRGSTNTSLQQFYFLLLNQLCSEENGLKYLQIACHCFLFTVSYIQRSLQFSVQFMLLCLDFLYCVLTVKTGV